MGGSRNSTIGEQGLLNVIALDRNGRKFANCSSLQFNYKIKGEGNVVIVPDSQTSYAALKDYLQSEQGSALISLKQKFEENPTVIYTSDLPEGAPAMQQENMMYNNFGICEQVQVSAAVEGLGRVRAVY